MTTSIYSRKIQQLAGLLHNLPNRALTKAHIINKSKHKPKTYEYMEQLVEHHLGISKRT